MKTYIRKSPFRVSLICLFLLVLTPFSSSGKLYLETDTATGIVADIANSVITLDSGVKYYPANDRINLDVEVGSHITLRFFKDLEQKNRYTEVAPGINSLPELPAPKVKKEGYR